MKYIKYLAIAAGLIAILLAIGWFLRNSIIERISNPLLAQYNLRVTDVSLDALATRNASISHLEFEHISGAIVAIENLILPIRISTDGFRNYSAEKIVIELPAGGDGETPGPAQVLRQLLALPGLLPQVAVNVGSIDIAPYPGIRNARWQLSGDDQQLTLIVNATSMRAGISRTAGANHLLEFSFADESGSSSEQTLTVGIQPTPDGFALVGNSTLDLVQWQPLIELLGIDNIDIQSGNASLHFDTEIPNDTSRELAIFADITLTSPVHLEYSAIPDENISLTLESPKPFEITASAPDLDWAVRQADVSMSVSYGALPKIRISLANYSCRATRACSGDMGFLMEQVTLPFARFDRLEFLAAHELTFAENTLAIRLLPNATLSLAGISDQDLSLAEIAATLNSAATIDFGGDGWRFSADSIDLSIESLTIGDDLTISIPVFLDKVEVSQQDQALLATLGVYASASEIAWDGQLISLPGFSGGISRQENEIAVILETSGLYEEAGIEVSHNFDQNSGQLIFRGAVLSFDAQDLASRVRPWQPNWNVSSGTLAIEAQMEWQPSANGPALAGESAIAVANLAGMMDDIAFAGLSTRIDAKFDSQNDIVVEPSDITIALVEIGLPVENIFADFRLNPDGPAVDVENLRMQIFDGIVTAAPFSFSTANERNTVRLKAESIDLGRILSLQEFDSIEISGSIGAEIPVTFDGDEITISGGSLFSEPPGGVIRYLPGLAADEADLSALGIATRALSYFEYDTLTSAIDYTADGDLNLQMRLTGRNPDMENSRPVILNLGIENNMPKLFKSLQATRNVEEILERRLVQ